MEQHSFSLQKFSQSSVTPAQNNWAFIDMQNLNKGVKEKGWKIKWASFRKYLRDVHGVTRAISFLGYVKEYENIYKGLRRAGFQLEFRRVKRLGNGQIEGGNVDADLASFVMDYKRDYDKAIIVADDGDYCRTIQSLNRQNKLMLVISSHSIQSTSELIKQAIGKKKILSIHSLRNFVERVKAA